MCKQEAESPSVRMEGLERRFEVLLEGLLTSFCLLQVLKPLLSAFPATGVGPDPVCWTPSTPGPQRAKGMSEADGWEKEVEEVEKITALKAAKGES